MEVTVAGQDKRFDRQAGKLAKITRTWKDNDRVDIRLAMPIAATHWPRNGAVTIDRGPLSYSIRIKEDWQQLDPKRLPNRPAPEDWPRFSVQPASPWNYGLVIDPQAPAGSISVEMADAIADQPWNEPDAPVVLKVPAKRIPDWKVNPQTHTVDAVREGPVRSDEPVETIEMIPMGCARLRMTVLPCISDRLDARYWNQIPDPGTYMLDRLE
jgi:hypothetical protein